MYKISNYYVIIRKIPNLALNEFLRPPHLQGGVTLPERLLNFYRL